MRYSFRDLGPAADNEVELLPFEAMTFNGVTIEKVIPEYQTLQVMGRELMGQTLDTLKVGQQDGERIQGHSIPPREITVKYQINADSPERFRAIFYELNQILSGVDNKFYFADDPEKYFVGTLEEASVPDGGKLQVVSDFTILCNDPYAYSVNEDEFSFADKATTQTFLSDFNGKVAGDLVKVPHTILTNLENITVAMAAPDQYKTELEQLNYSNLSTRNNVLAGLKTTAVRNQIAGKTYDPTQDSLDNGALDTITLEGDKITFDGWFATNGSVNKPYTYIIVTNPDTSREYGRVKIDLKARADVGRARPNIANSAKSGFQGTIAYTDAMANNKIRIIFRYSDTETGEGNYEDWSAYATTSQWWRWTMPHMLIKLDVLQMAEQTNPGFWSKYQIVSRYDKLAWLKAHLNTVKLKAWAYGLGPSGNHCTMQVWDQKNSWTGKAANTASEPSLLEQDYTKPDDFFSDVSADGYMYINIYPEYAPAEAKGDSYVYVDYFVAEMNVDLPAADALTVENDGPLSVPVRFEITNHGENGFVGIQGQDLTRAVLIGSPNQQDGGEVSKSERLFTTDQTTTDLTKQFKINAGIVAQNEDARQVGGFTVPNLTRWFAYTKPDLTDKGFGAALATNRGWHGPSLHRDFGPDSEGTVGANNWQCRNYIYFKTTLVQSGNTNIVMQGADGTRLCSFQIWSGINQNASVSIRVGDKEVYSDANNPRWNSFFGSVLIKRFGNTYSFEIQDVEGGLGTKQTYTVDDATSAKIKCTGWTYQKMMWGNWTQISNQDFYDMWYQVDNVNVYVDIPNTFVEGDVITIDGTENKVISSINGTQSLALQGMGSKTIMALPGSNNVAIMYSDFADRPDVKAYIRKKYL